MLSIRHAFIPSLALSFTPLALTLIVPRALVVASFALDAHVLRSHQELAHCMRQECDGEGRTSLLIEAVLVPPLHRLPGANSDMSEHADAALCFCAPHANEAHEECRDADLPARLLRSFALKLRNLHVLHPHRGSDVAEARETMQK